MAFFTDLLAQAVMGDQELEKIAVVQETEAQNERENSLARVQEKA